MFGFFLQDNPKVESNNNWKFQENTKFGKCLEIFYKIIPKLSQITIENSKKIPSLGNVWVYFTSNPLIWLGHVTSLSSQELDSHVTWFWNWGGHLGSLFKVLVSKKWKLSSVFVALFSIKNIVSRFRCFRKSDQYFEDIFYGLTLHMWHSWWKKELHKVLQFSCYINKAS